MADSVPGSQAAEDGLIVDELAERFRRFQLLQADDEDQANRLLEEFGSHGVLPRAAVARRRIRLTLGLTVLAFLVIPLAVAAVVVI